MGQLENDSLLERFVQAFVSLYSASVLVHGLSFGWEMEIFVFYEVAFE